MPLTTRQLLLAGLLAAWMPLATGCVDVERFEDNGDVSDKWNGSNSPDKLGTYEHYWQRLNSAALEQGEADITPWPGSYWPMQEDGFNARWLGQTELSPTEAYDAAFNGWVPSMGFEAFLKLRKFEQPGVAYDQSYYDELGPAATWAHRIGGNFWAKEETDPDGSTSWFGDPWGGIEGWYGHCNAWAAAAMSVAEPQHSVTMNGIRFEVSDIKALIEATYDGIEEMFLGGRCHEVNIDRDTFGRIEDELCRDTNAGAFHVVTLNRLGIERLSYILDVSPGLSVWNQPVRGYEILLQEEIELEEALRLVNRDDQTQYPYNDFAKRFVHVIMNLKYMDESSASMSPWLDQVERYTESKTYEYVLELAQDGYIMGGEWIGTSDFPDFIWAPRQAQPVKGLERDSFIIDTDIVDQLHQLSLAPEAP